MFLLSLLVPGHERIDPLSEKAPDKDDDQTYDEVTNSEPACAEPCLLQTCRDPEEYEQSVPDLFASTFLKRKVKKNKSEEKQD